MQDSRTTWLLIFLGALICFGARAGTVVAWGDNSLGETNVPPNLTNVTAIAAGGFHSLALKADGTVVAWGDNSLNQGTVPDGLSNVVAIAAGENHSCALKHDGTIVQWGDNAIAPVGAEITNIVAIAAGGMHTLGLKTDGTVIGWGNDFYGQCDAPAGLSNVIAIAAGEFHSIALKADGTVVTWGDDRNEQCSGGLITNAVAIGAGAYHTLGITRNGSVLCFGDNSCGQTNAPADLTTATSVAGGSCFSLAATKGGTIVGWGNAGLIPNVTGVAAIASGRAHGVALVTSPSTSLSIGMQNGNANVQWSDISFQLQTSTNIFNAASWQNIATGTNAYATSPAGTARFFRLIKN